MSSVSDLLGNCGLQFESEIYSDEGYYLCRVDYQGRKYVAEISSNSSVFHHRWPSVTGLMRPVSAKDLPSQNKLLLFDIGEAHFLSELLKTIGGLSLDLALKYMLKILAVISELQAAGMISGYLGPEMFIVSDSHIFMLAGGRGIPKSPFTAPEVQSIRPSDPRSDVFAFGSLLFRLLAGTDEEMEQVATWQKLGKETQDIISQMVAPLPVDRSASLTAVSELLCSMQEMNTISVSEDLITNTEPTGFVKKSKRKSKKILNTKWYWIFGTVLVCVLAFFAFNDSGLPDETDSEEIVDEIQEQIPEEEVVSPWEDSGRPADPETDIEEEIEEVFVPVVDSAVIWISNCTGTSGLEQDFRAEAASSYSFVYPLIGTTNRQTSIILVRRTDPTIPIEDTPIGQAALNLAAADSTFQVKAVDLTIMLGTDLNYSGINAHYLHSPENPSDTLFVDVVNHGIQYSLDGLGAATWFAAKIEGRAFDFNEREFLIVVSDIRDADRFNEEVGMPEVLNETRFMMKESNIQAASLEALLRQFFQPLPTTSNFDPSDMIIPDIHVLLGQNTD